MAGIASLVLGFRFVSNFVLGRSVSVMDRVRMGVLLAAIFIACVVVRKFTYQGAMDLSLEGALLGGISRGRLGGHGGRSRDRRRLLALRRARRPSVLRDGGIRERRSRHAPARAGRDMELLAQSVLHPIRFRRAALAKAARQEFHSLRALHHFRVGPVRSPETVPEPRTSLRVLFPATIFSPRSISPFSCTRSASRSRWRATPVSRYFCGRRNASSSMRGSRRSGARSIPISSSIRSIPSRPLSGRTPTRRAR